MKLVMQCIVGGIGAGVFLFCVVMTVIFIQVGFDHNSSGVIGGIWLLLFAALYGLCGAVAGGLLALVLLLIRRVSRRAAQSDPQTPRPSPDADKTVWPPPPA